MARVVVITGASAGVGRATAIRFAREGASVALLARGAAGLEGARRDVEAVGGRPLVVPTDVADAAAVHAAAERVERELGPIDVWINVAMASVLAPVVEVRADEYRRVTEVTYLGQVHGAQAALKHMLPRDRGRIILIGSALAYRGIPLQSAYCAAKHAVQGFADSLRSELLHARSGVTVTMVQLPAMNTPQFGWVRSRMPMRSQPVPPVYQPEVAAEAIFLAAAQGRRELYVGLSTWIAIVGDKVAPGLADRYLGATGVGSQQTSEPEPAGRPDNLFSPGDDTVDHGAHGRFDAIAHRRSELLVVARYQHLFAAALAIAGLAAFAARRRFRTPGGPSRQ